MAKLTIEQMINDPELGLELEVLAGYEGLKKEITEHDVNRPGLALLEHFEFFGSKRIQLLGKGEIAYLQGLSPKQRRHILTEFFEYPIPCFLIAWGQDTPEELINLAQERQVPVLRTHESTGKANALLTLYLEKVFAPEEKRHGNLVEVHGIGVLILGDAGIGKSETALELLERGQRLIADDVVIIKRIGNVLVGYPSEIIQQHLEIRGVGIIDIEKIFGVGSVAPTMKIDLAVNLEQWEKGKMYDQLGIDEKYRDILGVKIPELLVPVQPGRNISVIIEVAAMNQRLKKRGHYTAKEFEKKIIQLMHQTEEEEGARDGAKGIKATD